MLKGVNFKDGVLGSQRVHSGKAEEGAALALPGAQTLGKSGGWKEGTHLLIQGKSRVWLGWQWMWTAD